MIKTILNHHSIRKCEDRPFVDFLCGSALSWFDRGDERGRYQLGKHREIYGGRDRCRSGGPALGAANIFIKLKIINENNW